MQNVQNFKQHKHFFGPQLSVVSCIQTRNSSLYISILYILYVYEFRKKIHLLSLIRVVARGWILSQLSEGKSHSTPCCQTVPGPTQKDRQPLIFQTTGTNYANATQKGSGQMIDSNPEPFCGEATPAPPCCPVQESTEYNFTRSIFLSLPKPEIFLLLPNLTNKINIS